MEISKIQASNYNKTWQSLRNRDSHE